jgi:DNA-binding NarL/FixJ family response regulator
MPSDEKNQNTIISQTRFLVIEPNPKVGEGLRRFLLSEKSPAVHVAPTPVLALRVLQERRTPVDCIICAHDPKEFSSLDFLANLRSGRWGGLSHQHLKFILLMSSEDEYLVQAADNLRATGYIIGSLSRENVRDSLLQALDPGKTAAAPPNFKVAHVRAAEADLILAPFPPSFGRLPSAQQQQAIQAVALAAQKAGLSGGVAAVYPAENGEAAFVAPAIYERFLSRVTIASLDKLLNRPLYVEWTGGDPTAEAEAPTEATDLLDDLFGPSPISEEEITDRRRSAAKKGQDFTRGLTDDNIRAVALAFKEMGAEEFARKFVRHQTILLQDEAQPLTPMMREFYVSIDLLRSTFFPGVEMRGSNRYFQSLTHMLDQLMLRSLPYLPLNGRACSLNLNVHSILTQTFENALKNTRADLLTFEIPQPMIASHFEEFKKARDLIRARGGKIAVDQIFPDTMGSLNLDEVQPDFAKLHWKGDLKKFNATHRDFVKKSLDKGITMVMSRVDDPAAFEIGQKFGIQNFQGFLIEEMPEAKATADNS